MDLPAFTFDFVWPSVAEGNYPHIPSVSSYGIPFDRQNFGRGAVFKTCVPSFLADRVVGDIYRAEWVPNMDLQMLCYTSRVNIIEGPDLPRRIWSSDCDWQINHLEGRDGLWRVPPMTKSEGWCLMVWDKSAITCAVSVARVDGIEREFEIRVQDILSFLIYAKNLFEGELFLKAVIGQATCGPENVDIEWKVYCPVEHIPSAAMEPLESGRGYSSKT
ncbi:hypothetical protein F4809DRAFT_645574 [Biscogniauxia mediterranea]|nr:hypothetical protein F4809DRAFT_645574 [Biscogniauxia mediterranea]